MDDLGWSSPARRAEADAFNGLAPPAGVLQDVQDLLAAGWIFEGIDRKDGWVRVYLFDGAAYCPQRTLIPEVWWDAEEWRDSASVRCNSRPG